MLLSIIIPCYNEAKDIKKNVEFLNSFLISEKIDAEIICVSDGSKDDTFEIIKKIPYVKGIGYEINKGKGGAVQQGILDATGDFVLFMDADLSTDLEALNRLVPLLDQYDIIIGSRHHKESQTPIKQPAKRRFIGWCCRKIVNRKFHMKYTDTQCGFKAIKTSIAKEIAKLQTIYDFAFDIEYLYIAKLFHSTVKEIPVIWRDDRGSTVSPFKSSIKFFIDLKRIKRNKKYYLSER